MAVVIRCSGFFTRPSSPLNHFTGKSNGTGKLATFLLNARNVLPRFGDALCSSSSSPLEIHRMFRGTTLQLNNVDIRPTAMRKIDQGVEQVRSRAIAFLIANALMITTPLEALAETCEADNSLFNMNMPLLLAVAIIGATVGGLVARQRKGELQRVNEQLRQINAALRRQAKIESYAPTLSYAPVGVNRIPEDEVIVDPKKQELISRLKTGKTYLRNQDPEKAFEEFKTSLELATAMNDLVEEKKAARGLGASLQRMGKHREAIKYHKMVLAISKQAGEESGNTEAYGAIADCYTELGDLEQAGKYYDNYIARLETD
ncbi:hypothetical protein ACFE04_021730 [Oxalis oulophora]